MALVVDTALPTRGARGEATGAGPDERLEVAVRDDAATGCAVALFVVVVAAVFVATVWMVLR